MASAPNPPAVLRDLRWEDFPDLVANYYRCYDERDAGEEIGIHLEAERPSLTVETAWFTRLYTGTREGSIVGAVAEAGSRAVGAGFVTRQGLGPTSELAHVGDLGLLVHHDHRGRGIGRALLVEVLRRCRGRFELVTLTVFATNERAQRLYRSVGFEGCGRLPRGVRRGDRYIDLDRMVLRL